MTILACEDVGLADPQALVVVNAAAQAFERIGMPEGNFLLAEACLYLATAPKSNTTNAIFAAISHIEKHGARPVPPHLRDSTASANRARHEGTVNASADYKYPHDFPGAWVEQQYLPVGMERPRWYRPKSLGYEQQIAAQMLGRGDDAAPVSSPASAFEAVNESVSESAPASGDVSTSQPESAKPENKPTPKAVHQPMTRPAPKPSAKGKDK